MINLVPIAIGCFAAFVLMTVALVRGVPRIVWVGALCCFGTAVVLVLLLRDVDRPRGEKREIPVTPELASSLRAMGLPISVERAFEASSFGGWHGDGASLTAYRYPPTQSNALVDALKSREKAFAWSEVPAQTYDFAGLRQLLPPGFLPERDAWSLVVGRPADGPPVSEFVVDRAKGTLYSITNVF